MRELPIIVVWALTSACAVFFVAVTANAWIGGPSPETPLASNSGTRASPATEQAVFALG